MSSRTSSALAVGVVAAAALLLTACANPGIGFNAPSPVGVWSESSAEDSPYLSLSDDGRLTGFDGCNQLTGDWSESAGNITFENLASTRMACEDVDTWLEGAMTGLVEGETMTISGENDAVIGELERTSETPMDPEEG